MTKPSIKYQLRFFLSLFPRFIIHRSKFGIILLLCMLASHANASKFKNSVLELERSSRLSTGYIGGSMANSIQSQDFHGLSMQHIFSFKPDYRKSFGLGTGMHFMEEETYLPVYLDFTYQLGNAQYWPYMDFQAGYALAWKKERALSAGESYQGGPTLGLGLGKGILNGELYNIFLQVNYKYQASKAKLQDSANQLINENRHNHFFEISLGLLIDRK